MWIPYLYIPHPSFARQLFTMLVFIQPKCVKYQHTYPGTSMLEAYVCVIFKLDKIQTTIRRFSSTVDRSSPHEDVDGIGFSLNFHAMIRRLSSTVGRASPYEDGDGIGFQDYNADQPPASEVEDVEKSVGTFETDEAKTAAS
jgi:hypothetical protein